MKILIIEDEIPALENLKMCIAGADSSIQIAGTTRSVAESIAWLHNNPSPDLILMDIQLSDGLCFHIFNEYNIQCPVIFTTAYDKYMIEAFEYNCIDYLLKPIDLNKLTHTLHKYKHLQHYFVNNYPTILEYLNASRKNKSRIVVKKGTEFLSIRLDDVAYFFTEHKLVFLVDKDNKKYLCETNSLSDIEAMLDNKVFFRVNRKYIVNAEYITKFRSIEKSKISVEISLPVVEELIVSQENAAVFKKWISEI
jgi:two-component system LytT family response regulator